MVLIHPTSSPFCIKFERHKSLLDPAFLGISHSFPALLLSSGDLVQLVQLWLQRITELFHPHNLRTEVPFIQKVSGLHTSPCLHKDELRIAVRARKAKGAFANSRKRAPGTKSPLRTSNFPSRGILRAVTCCPSTCTLSKNQRCNLIR